MAAGTRGKAEPTFAELKQFAKLVAEFETSEELGEEFDADEQAVFFEEVIATARQIVGHKKAQE